MKKMMKKIIATPLYQVFSREIKRITRSRVMLFSTLIGPLASLLTIYWIFAAGVARDLPVTLIDQDQTALSRKVAQMIDANPTASIHKAPGISQALDELKKGQTEAIVWLPKDFEKEVIKGNSPEVVLYINNTNVVKGGVLYSGLYKTLATISGGVKFNIALKKGMTENQAMASIQPIQMDTHLLFNPFGNYAYFLTIGLLPIMITVFTFLVSVYALGLELKMGTGKELLDKGGNSIFITLTGKMLPYTILFFLHTMVMNIILFQALGTPLKGSLVVILFSEWLLIITYQLLAVVLLNLTANMRLSLSLGSAYTMMALTFAGLTFPSIAMPLLAKIFSWLFPYTFWLKIFISQTIKGQPLYTTAYYFLILLVFIIASMFAFFGIKKKLADERYWGKS
jgi:ABC-2 type transport system permease protein